MTPAPGVEICGALGGRTAHVRADGRIRGAVTCLDITLVALGPPTPRSPVQYIEVDGAHGGVHRVEVGLHVAAIDAATVRKALVMLNNYRRLREGRHEFAGAAKPMS